MSDLFFLVAFAIILMVLIFAIVGLAHTLAWLFGRRSTKDRNSPKTRERASFHADVAASMRLVEHLSNRGQVNEATASKLIDFLAQLGRDVPDPTPIEPTKLSSKVDLAESKAEDTSIRLTKKRSDLARQESEDKTKPTIASVDVRSQVSDRDSNQTGKTGLAEPVVAEVVSEQKTSRLPTKPAPWELPDPEPAPPRRSFAEVMSGFMQEKNMRWGELTSGVLIVLSAVGLVLSLRDQLSDVIPYFSSLLFMLMTGAIIGAGIYTLKKWKLRNTSRGTLVIGLLLIPLNFIAACILSGGENRREFSDPWLWIAFATGAIGFGTLTWLASKYLLRRFHLPVVISILGCGIGTLVINRCFAGTGSTWQLVLTAIPVAIAFVMGSGILQTGIVDKSFLSRRVVNRIFLTLGISVFAALTALALFLIRADSGTETFVSLTPLLVLISLVTGWIGWQVSNCERLGDQGQKLVAISILVLGLLLAALFTLGSLVNPIVFSLNCFLVFLGSGAVVVSQHEYRLIPVAFSAFTFSFLTVYNLLSGSLPLDQWASALEFREAAISGQTGLCLLFCGLISVGLGWVVSRAIPKPSKQARAQTYAVFTGSAIFLVGCGLSLIASLVNRDRIFDTMTASCLLLIAGFGGISALILIGRRRDGRSVDHGGLVNYSALILLGGLFHTFLWNPTCAAWLNQLTHDVDSNWIFVLSIYGLVVTAVATLVKTRSDKETLFRWGTVSSGLAGVSAILIVPLQTGFATGVAIVTAIAYWLNGSSASKAGIHNEMPTRHLFVFSTGWVVAIAASELISRFDWCPSWTHTRFWLILVIGLAIWCCGWVVMNIGFAKSNSPNWLTSAAPRVDQMVQFGLVLALISMVGNDLILGSIAELSTNNFGVGLDLRHQRIWLGIAILAVGIVSIFAAVEKTNKVSCLQLVILWFCVWSSLALPYVDSNATASALRWLMPIGGLVLAVTVFLRGQWLVGWLALRRGLGLTGESRLSSAPSQSLINVALSIVVIVVLLLATITISQVMLNGAEALGGPVAESFFGKMDKVVSFGVPIALVVSAFLIYAISEGRPWLATAGSTVFQYMVVLAICLLFLSPHPKLASEWFVRILQSISLGMTCYGLVWYATRSRIDRNSERTTSTNSTRGFKLNQIEVHTLINGMLVTSLAVLVYGRFFFVPDQHGDWINSVGRLLGVAAWFAFALLAWLVFQAKLRQPHASKHWLWLIGWMGFVMVSTLASVTDQFLEARNVPAQWWAYTVLTVGSVMILATQLIFLWRFTQSKTEDSVEGSWSINLPMFLFAALGLAFSVRGAWYCPTAFWLFFTLIVVVNLLVFAFSLIQKQATPVFVSGGIGLVATTVFCECGPTWMVPTGQPIWLNYSSVVLAVISMTSLVYYHIKKLQFNSANSGRFVLLANLVMLAVAAWMLFGSFVDVVIDLSKVTGSFIANPVGSIAMVSGVALLLVSLWNDRRLFWSIAFCMMSLSIGVSLTLLLPLEEENLVVSILFAGSVVACGWGIGWANRRFILRQLESLKAPAITKLERQLRVQLPIYMMILAGLLIVIVFIGIFNVEPRPLRFLLAFIPFLLAIGCGCLSDTRGYRWLQIVCLGLVSLGCLLVGWADLQPVEMTRPSTLSLLVRSLLVTAGLAFIYGALVPRWVRGDDSWLKSLREMAVASCGIGMLFLGLVLLEESFQFSEEFGCGLSVAEATSAAVVVLGMVIGLITIAVRPKHDPFSLTIQGRQIYVYLAQLVTIGLVLHLYFSMPWLFQFGIREYWPYVAMAICFAGVGLSRILESRQLQVLGKPLFVTAVLLPVLTAVAIFGIESQADAALVMLTVGLAYLLISYTNQSIVSGAASLIFGNLALWMFYGKFPHFAFLEHPQIWLIPPAVSVLIAARIFRDSLTRQQLTAINYICVTVIYVSSTSEVFIRGLGDQLWPPMVLAFLAVLGIFAGILMQIRSFLYLGSLFLLIAMITMVAHAHQRFDHVWPWWAFGITLGIAILVMFGLFEKKKNEMKAIAGQLREWDG